MKGIAIYVEGGGDSAQQKAELRQGLDALLNEQKQAAQRKKLSWKTIPSGGRQQTFDAFHHALQISKEETLLLILLVDSEDAIALESNDAANNAKVRVQHLHRRDGWDLSGIDPGQVHLMVRCMEAWIAADPEALSSFYGRGFHSRSLPTRQNLEEESKPNLQSKLKKATQKTHKGEYQKIKHASKLLGKIDPMKIGKRCPRFLTFTKCLSQAIGRA